MKYDPILGDDWIPRVLTSIYSCIIIGLSKNRGSTPNSILTVKIFIQWMKWGALIFRLKFIRTIRFEHVGLSKKNGMHGDTPRNS